MFSNIVPVIKLTAHLLRTVLFTKNSCFFCHWLKCAKNLQKNAKFARHFTETVFLAQCLSVDSLKSCRSTCFMEPEIKKMRVETKCVLRFAKLTENAFEPIKGSAKAAGFDLRSAYDCTVPARGKQLVKTDLQIQVPEGSYGRVAPRSGLAVKNFIDVGAGVVDEDYRGNLGVVLFNHSDTDFEVKKGDRIAQLICEKIFYPELEKVDSLAQTQRGEGGFGSTGLKELLERKTGNGARASHSNDASDSTNVDLSGGAFGSTGLKELLEGKNGNGNAAAAKNASDPTKA